MKTRAVNSPKSNTTTDLIETLAAIEHEQWMYWSRAVAGNVPAATRAKWRRSWVDYAKLTEDMKEADRVWAREVVAVLRKRRLIP